MSGHQFLSDTIAVVMSQDVNRFDTQAIQQFFDYVCLFFDGIGVEPLQRHSIRITT